MKDWQSIWLVFALSLVLGIVFALSFNYRHSPQESAVAAQGRGAAWLRPNVRPAGSAVATAASPADWRPRGWPPRKQRPGWPDRPPAAAASRRTGPPVNRRSGHRPRRWCRPRLPDRRERAAAACGRRRSTRRRDPGGRSGVRLRAAAWRCAASTASPAPHSAATSSRLSVNRVWLSLSMAKKSSLS